MTKLDAASVQQLIYSAMPEPTTMRFEVRDVSDSFAAVILSYQKWMLRPGGTLSGPAIMTVADLGMYALVLAQYGPELLAVTSDLNIRFLSKPRPADLLAEVRFLKQGRRLLVMECTVRHVGQPEILAQVTGSYVRPETSPES